MDGAGAERGGGDEERRQDDGGEATER
jgi:hypothetical protein